MRTNLGSESAGMRLFDTDMCLPHLGPISANSPPNRKGLRTELSNRCWLCYEFFGKTIVSSPLITGWTLTAVILSCTELAAAGRPARASKYRPSITIMIVVQCISVSVALALSAGESPTRDRGPGGSDSVSRLLTGRHCVTGFLPTFLLSSSCVRAVLLVI
jgi:hypothetical protein